MRTHVRAQIEQLKDLERIQNRLTTNLSWLVVNIETKKAVDYLNESRQLLESLPSSTSEYGWACSRLENAGSYASANEFGAARYELRLLLKSLRAETSAPLDNTAQSFPAMELP